MPSPQPDNVELVIRWSALVLVGALGCSAARPVPTTPPPPPPAPPPAADPITMPEGCPPLAEIEGERLDATTTVAVIDCRLPSSDEESYTWPMGGYMVIRVTPTTGEVIELGTWEQGHENSGHHELVGILRDASGVATKLLVVERRGGLDQFPSNTLMVYELKAQTFAATLIVAENMDVEVAPDGRSAKVTTCDSRLTSVAEHPVECKDEPNPKLATVELR